MRCVRLSHNVNDNTAVNRTHTSYSLLQGPSTQLDTAAITCHVVYVHGSGPSSDDTIFDASTGASFGVYWGKGDPRNTSQSVQGSNQTQHIATLEAIIHVLSTSQRLEGRLEIHTASQYAVRACSTWRLVWIKNGWKTARNDPVKHQDSLKKILELEHHRLGPTIYKHISGSDAAEGRVEAAKLAASPFQTRRQGTRG
ncbi:hypothetical protein BCR43DRAFT_502469 [Syncephalastrum racemosum]|uniref:ribonuclease H n=1 Tax=Syncephalastrum racemosum TaxID=13706 RepID=A0A1X2HN85_SYNRA|nr:hypothetical protein BCR43DRAFT_502469 [Syncephalastrum racemosum]